MASDYLPGVYTRIGTEENPGTFRGGSGSGISKFGIMNSFGQKI